jgi:outer membrane protein assembly factor BamB
MAKRIIVTECPECGAPIDPTLIADPDNPSCPFCHTILPTAAEHPRPIVVTRPPMASPPRPVRRHRGLVGTIVVLLVVAVAAVVAISVAHAAKIVAGGGGGDYRIAGPIVPVSAAAGNDDVYVLAPDASDTDHVVLRKVDLRTHQTIWSTAGIQDSDGGSADIVAAGSSVVVIAESTVVAFSAATGAQRWQSGLSTPLTSRASFEGLPGGVADCLYGCAAELGATLVTLDKDGTVQAFATGNGAQLWSHRLSDTPDWMQPAGGDVAIVSAPQPGDDELLLFDPTTGRERTISPSCGGDGEGDTAVPSEDGGFFVSPDGKTLSVLVTGSGGCVASYRIADGAIISRTAPDAQNSQIPFTLTGESAVAGAGYVAWTNELGEDRWIFVTGEDGGRVRQLWDTGSEDSTVSLDGAAGGTLVVEVAPSYASDQPAIYGISLSTGRMLWKLPARTAGDDVNGNQTVVVTSTGLGIASCQSTADESSGTCKLEAVNPATGTIRGSAQYAVSDILPTAEATPGAAGGVLADLASDLVVAFDPVIGKADGVWPS